MSREAPGKAIRAGRQYLDGIRDDREVWSDGERIADVTTDRRFAGGARTLAELYDFRKKIHSK